MSFCKNGCGTGFNSSVERECHEEQCKHRKFITQPIECYATVSFNNGGNRKEQIEGYYSSYAEAIEGGGCDLRRIIRLVQTTSKMVDEEC